MILAELSTHTWLEQQDEHWIREERLASVWGAIVAITVPAIIMTSMKYSFGVQPISWRNLIQAFHRIIRWIESMPLQRSEGTVRLGKSSQVTRQVTSQVKLNILSTRRDSKSLHFDGFESPFIRNRGTNTELHIHAKKRCTPTPKLNC